MGFPPSRHAAGLALVLILASLGGSIPRARGAARMTIPELPGVVLWAWERPEDLRGLNPRSTGVAYLAATYYLKGDRIEFAPRRQPLRVDPGTPLVGVVRLETDRKQPPVFARDRTRWLAEDIAKFSRTPGVRAVQIDFDAVESERPFYRTLIGETRAALNGTPLSITALTSWCLGDNWIADLPVQEAVPMLFRLGSLNDRALKRLGADGLLESPLCATAVGVSTDEPTPHLRGHRRLYIFRPTPWTPAAATAAPDEVARWR